MAEVATLSVKYNSIGFREVMGEMKRAESAGERLSRKPIRLNAKVSSVDRATTALNRTAKSADKATKEVGLLRGAIQDLGGVTKHALGGLVAFFAIGKIQEFIGSIGDANKEYASIINTINAGTQDMAQARSDFQFLARLSQKLGLDLQQVAGAYGRLSVSMHLVGATSKELNDIFRGMAQAFTATHRSGEEVNRFLIQLEQALSNGKIQARDLRAMSQSMPGTLEIFKKAVVSLGGSLQELSSGNMDIVKVMERVADIMSGRFSKAAKEASHSFVAATNRLKSTMFVIKTSGSFATVAAAAIDRLNRVLQSKEGKDAFRHFVDSIGKALSNIIDIAIAFVKHIDEIIVAVKLLASVVIGRLVSGALVALGTKLIAVSKIISRLVIATRRWGVSIRSVNAALRSMRLAEISTGIGAILAVVGSLASAFYLLIGRSKSYGEQMDVLNGKMHRNESKLRSLVQQWENLSRVQKESAFALAMGSKVKGFKKLDATTKQIKNLRQQNKDEAEHLKYMIHHGLPKRSDLASEINSKIEERKRKIDVLKGDAQKTLETIGKMSAVVHGIKEGMNPAKLLSSGDQDGSSTPVGPGKDIMKDAKDIMKDVKDRMKDATDQQHKWFQSVLKTVNQTITQHQRVTNSLIQQFGDRDEAAQAWFNSQKQRIQENVQDHELAMHLIENANKQKNERMKGGNEEMSQFAIQAARNIQNAFADFLFNPFDKGLKGMLVSFGTTLRKMAAQVLANKILTSVFSSLSGISGPIGDFFGDAAKMLSGRASGGPVRAGQPYIVGERRPELFVPNTSGRIIPQVPQQQSNDVVVNVNNAPEGTQVRKRREGRKEIIDVMIQDIAEGGEFTKSLMGMTNVRRAGT